MLAARGKQMLRSLQGPSRLFHDGTADVSFIGQTEFLNTPGSVVCCIFFGFLRETKVFLWFTSACIVK